MRQDDVLIKGTREGLLVLLTGARDYAALRRRLEERLAASGRFFAGGEVTVDLGGRSLSPAELRDLSNVIRQRSGLRVTQVRGGTVVRGEEAAEPPEQVAFVLRRTLRSGQQLRYEGSVVVAGDVNPGAEVIAGGDIVVLGALRGLAHAGARGNRRAIVAAFRLQPVQLRIGDLIARSPDGPEKESGSGPEVARVRDGLVVIERYPNLWSGTG